jgi:hypothetical protein
LFTISVNVTKCKQVSNITFQTYSEAKNICLMYESKVSQKRDLNCLIKDYPFSNRAKNVLQNMFEDKNPTMNDLDQLVKNIGKKNIMKYRHLGNQTWDELIAALSLE